MNMDRIDGTVKQAVGKGEEFVGKFGERPNLQAQGLADQVAGTAQNLYGRTKDGFNEALGRTKDGFNDAVDRLPDALNDAANLGQRAYKESSQQVGSRVSKQPLEALLLAGAIGYLVGWAFHRSAR